MPTTLYDSSAKDREEEQRRRRPKSSVVSGTVVNNCDITKQGKILVRIPSLEQEVWARLSGPGAGSGSGFFYVPRPDDEVLVALNDGEPGDAFIMNGLWNTQDTPPVSNFAETPSTRVIKTGLKGGLGHKVEFDDIKQSITITTSTEQTIVLEPTKIEVSTTKGAVKITLDTTGQLTLEAKASVAIKSTGTLKLEATAIEITAKSNLTLKGLNVAIN